MMAMLLSADSVLSCFLNTEIELAQVHTHLGGQSVTIEGNPVIRTRGFGVLRVTGLVDELIPWRDAWPSFLCQNGGK